MSGHMRTKIIGTGSSLPATVVTNEDLTKIMDTTDEWISTRTGIKERRLVKDETTSQMAADASRKALADAGISADELDLIIVGTLTADDIVPAAACRLQADLGAEKAVAFDVNAACSGFLFALHIANAYLQAGIYKTALIVGAEALSRIMDWTDRSTCVLFGDGAGAAVVRCDEQGGLLAYDQGSDGSKGDALFCKARTNNNPLVTTPMTPGYVNMDGQEVYKFAVTTVPASIQKALDQAGLTVEDIDYFAIHQANIRIIRAIAKRLQAPEEKFPIALDHCGNISAASVPILLDEMNQKGLLKPGCRIVLAGFGGGLTWASAVLEW